jgi:hypothetical protein
VVSEPNAACNVERQREVPDGGEQHHDRVPSTTGGAIEHREIDGPENKEREGSLNQRTNPAKPEIMPRPYSSAVGFTSSSALSRSCPSPRGPIPSPPIRNGRSTTLRSRSKSTAFGKVLSDESARSSREVNPGACGVGFELGKEYLVYAGGDRLCRNLSWPIPAQSSSRFLATAT